MCPLRPRRCGATRRTKLSGEDLSRYSNKIESGGLRQRPYYRYVTKKAMSQ